VVAMVSRRGENTGREFGDKSAEWLCCIGWGGGVLYRFLLNSGSEDGNWRGFCNPVGAITTLVKSSHSLSSSLC